MLGIASTPLTELMLTIAPPPAAICRADRLADEEGALQIDVEHRVPVVLGDVEELRGAEDAGIVDERVDRAEGRSRRRQRRVDLVALGRRRSAGRGALPAAARRAARASPRGVVDVPEGDRRAVGGEPLRTGRADALRRAGDDSDAALEVEVNGDGRHSEQQEGAEGIVEGGRPVAADANGLDPNSTPGARVALPILRTLVGAMRLGGLCTRPVQSENPLPVPGSHPAQFLAEAGFSKDIRCDSRSDAASSSWSSSSAGAAPWRRRSLPIGAPIADARAALGGPTGEYVLPGGGTRLEFARGSFGRQTWMLDFDAAGRLVRKDQVLTEARFAEIVPGMTATEVRMRLGRPAESTYLGWQRRQLWSYRWWPGDCVVFQVSIDAGGSVVEAGMGTDLACGGPNVKD